MHAATRRLWLPGLFPSANQVHDLARREGAYRARAGGREPPEGYSWWARNVRGLACMHARAAHLPPVATGLLVCVWIWFVGHCRYDADGWTGAGKWVLDGLVDAHVLASDRRDVYQVGGRCFATDEEGAAFIAARDFARAPRPPGVLVEMTEGRP